MGIDDQPAAEKAPSTILGDLGFTMIDSEPQAIPKTFDVFKGRYAGNTIEAYDENKQIWSLATDDLEAVIEKLLKSGFTEAILSADPPSKDDAIN